LYLQGASFYQCLRPVWLLDPVHAMSAYEAEIINCYMILESGSLTIRLSPGDNVVVVAASVGTGEAITEEDIVCVDNIPGGHKVATQPIGKDSAIYKYGHIIGVASRDIRAGEHVHTHNMDMLEYDREYAFGARAVPTALLPETERAYFEGIVRANGSMATRNYICVMATAGCSSSVARFIAEAFRGEALAAFPNVDGVMAVVHSSGCGLADQGDGIDYLQRTLAGWAPPSQFRRFTPCRAWVRNQSNRRSYGKDGYATREHLSYDEHSGRGRHKEGGSTGRGSSRRNASRGQRRKAGVCPRLAACHRT